MSKTQGSEWAAFSQAATERVDCLTAEFRSKLRDAARELAEHLPDARIIGSELVELAVAKVCAELVAEFERGADEDSRVRDDGRDAA
ncbi:MAG: hypothetical protein IH987_19345 [Planctomycetes bacterium]|nr:hypothetical protein [Planctomycetota bacterium]